MTKKYVIHDKKCKKILTFVKYCYKIINDKKVREV